jgi:AcrR family transcriptional regulator
VSRRADLPSRDSVIRAADALLAQGGARPTVTALAKSLGVAPSTFWRHFPDQAGRIADRARGQQRSLRPDRAARLATENRDLRAQLELAAATIMRLTVENQRLSDELHRAQQVTPISRGRKRSVDD